MKFSRILTLLCVGLLALCLVLLIGLSQQARARKPDSLPQAGSDALLLQMQKAYWRKDQKELSQLLPLVRGHILEPWAAYWELKLRLEDAEQQEVQDFLARYPETYQEDRLRNDWLLLAGKRRDWAAFVQEYPNFRMQDDRQVRCYAAAWQVVNKGRGTIDDTVYVRDVLAQQQALGDGCLLAVDRLYQSGQVSDDMLWQAARLAVESGRFEQARDLVTQMDASWGLQVGQFQHRAGDWLAAHRPPQNAVEQELALLALLAIGREVPEDAANLMLQGWQTRLNDAQRDWAWAGLGKRAALRLQDQAAFYFGQVRHDSRLHDDLLVWKVRSALRHGQWSQVHDGIQAMQPETRQEPVWAYWKARAWLEMTEDARERERARLMLQEVAGGNGFYAKLAREDLGQDIVLPTAPAAPSNDKTRQISQHPGLLRAFKAFDMGLHSEGAREWNYWAALHQPGGMDDDWLHAASQLACARQVWDRCINTSELIRSLDDFGQRFPTPHRDAVLRQARQAGVDPAFVYGLMRQESRFVPTARSQAGASGMMQIMPATARETARKIGLQGFSAAQINELDTNLLLGMSYLRFALEDFDASLPLAAAAYNAGPGRPRSWRQGPLLEGAIWVENIPFVETRNYVKQVLSNTVDYALVLNAGQPQSLKARLGNIGPAAP